MSPGSFPSIRLAPITVYLASCLALVGAQAQLLTPSQVLPLSAPDSDARIAGKEVRLTTGSWLNESGVKRAINEACEAVSGCRVVEMTSNESTGRVLALILTGPDTDVLTHRLREASMVPSSLSVVDTGVTEELERQRSNQRSDIELQAIRSAQLRLSLSISPPLGSSAVGAGLVPAGISIDPISATREHQIQALQRAAGIARVVLDVEPANWWIGTVYERRDSLLFVAIGAAIAALGTTLLWRIQRQRRSEEGGEQIASQSTLIAMPEWDELTAWPEQPRPTLSRLSQAMTPHFAFAQPGAVGVACLALQEKPIDFSMDSQNNLGTPFALATPSVGGLDPSPSVTVPSAVAATAPLPADSDKHDRAELFTAQVEASAIASPAAVRTAITFAEWKRQNKMSNIPTLAAIANAFTTTRRTSSMLLSEWLDEDDGKSNAPLSPLERLTATGYPLPSIASWGRALKVIWAAPEIWDIESQAGKAASLSRTARALANIPPNANIDQTDRKHERDTVRAIVLAAIAGLTPIDVASVAAGGPKFTPRSLRRARTLLMETPTPSISENHAGAEAIAALARSCGIEVVIEKNSFRSDEDMTYLVQPLSTWRPVVESRLEMDVLW